MQSVNCGGVVSARAEMLFITIIYKEVLSHLGEKAREKAEQRNETLKSKLVEMNKGLSDDRKS